MELPDLQSCFYVIRTTSNQRQGWKGRRISRQEYANTSTAAQERIDAIDEDDLAKPIRARNIARMLRRGWVFERPPQER